MKLVALRNDTTDAELLSQIANGDSQSLGLLYDRYHADVRRFLGRLNVSAADADDLLQQTFLQVFNVASRFDGRASARAWIVGIAAVVARRHRHSLLRMAQRALRWSSEPPPPAMPSPGERLELSEEGARAARALGRLSPKKREVFVMIVMEEASGDEVALALGIPLATVWTRLHYARQDLRKYLEEQSWRLQAARE